MNKDILYHGSQFIIDKPEYGKGKIINDYGRGFYCTKHKELAKEWAVSENINGYINTYEIAMSKLKILDLRNDCYSILHWLALLLDNREFSVRSPVALRGRQFILENYLIDTTEYDLIIGYRADDSYFTFAQDFVAGTISLQKLSEAMRLGKLGEQIVLKSERAYTKIHFQGADFAEAQRWYDKKSVRDREARRAYRNSKVTADGLKELYMLDIMREGITSGDSRLR